MIPNTIHFIFGLEPEFGGKPFSFIHYLAVRAARAVNPDSTLVLHYAFEPSGEWWEAARNHLVLEKVSPPQDIFGTPIRSFEHKADVLRGQILRAVGGIYIDMDVICLRPFEGLRQHSMVMGIEANSGLCNAVILAEPEAPFLQLWHAAYRSFDPTQWNYHSVILPYSLALRNPELIHVVDEFTFFFPVFDNPLRRLLWSGDAVVWDRIAGICIDVYDSLKANPDHVPPGLRTGRHALPRRRFLNARDALKSRAWLARRLDDSICIHLWESVWWKPYLCGLTPDTLAKSGGLFSALIKRILPGEF